MLPEAGVFVVCDGMGGAAAGETATIWQRRPLLPRWPRQRRVRERSAKRCGWPIVPCTNRARRDRRLEGMGTTLVALSVSGNTAWLGHVGDSRCYRWRSGTLERLTQDHSLVEEQIRIGRMTREQARRSPMQNVITRAIGTRAEVIADVQEIDLRRDDMYLIASDGLTRELTTDTAIAGVLLASNSDLDATWRIDCCCKCGRRT